MPLVQLDQYTKTLKWDRCRYSDVSVFGFHPVKIITSGEGGITLTNDIQTKEKGRKLTDRMVIKSNLKC